MDLEDTQEFPAVDPDAEVPVTEKHRIGPLPSDGNADKGDDATWRCYLCPRVFIHGRFLAGHLMDIHGEAR